jgi:hypothetical protein
MHAQIPLPRARYGECADLFGQNDARPDRKGAGDGDGQADISFVHGYERSHHECEVQGSVAATLGSSAHVVDRPTSAILLRLQRSSHSNSEQPRRRATKKPGLELLYVLASINFFRKPTLPAIAPIVFAGPSEFDGIALQRGGCVLSRLRDVRRCRQVSQSRLVYTLEVLPRLGLQVTVVDGGAVLPATRAAGLRTHQERMQKIPYCTTEAPRAPSKIVHTTRKPNQ